MAKYKQIYIDIYKRNVFIFIGTHRDFKRWVEDEFKDDEDYDNFINYVITQESKNPDGTFWYNPGIGEGIIELRKFPKAPTEIAVAAHECLHAVFHMLDFCGVEYNINSSGESHTYMLEFILRELLNLKDYKTYDA